MGKTKRNKEIVKKETIIVGEPIVIEKDAIIEEEIKVEDTVEVEAPEVIIVPENIEEKPVVDNKKKKMYRVVIATPTHYVVNKDGDNITISEKNNYRRGDEVLM